MNIFFPVSECVPFAKTGGLADVAGALPNALAAAGHQVHVVMPLYPQVKRAGVPIEPASIEVAVELGQETICAPVWQAKTATPGLAIHFLQYDPFFDRPELYRSPSGGYPDNDRRFLFLCRGALELGLQLNLSWDIVHCHDWHTGLVPVLLNHMYCRHQPYARARSLLTIHNLAYQGHFPRETFDLTGLPETYFTPEGAEFWGGFNYLKTGLIYANWINTVSTTYAKEIQTKEYGYGLEGVLMARAGQLSGILNGLDYSVWNPRTDEYISHPFDAQSPEGKAKVKERLLEVTGLYPLEGAPLIGMITRLDAQKGCDLIADAAEKLMKLNVQLVVLGTGDKKYHDFFLKLKAKYPRRLSLHLEFNNSLAHLIYGGADMFLMPSKYEPCGLGQLISMRYGTVPIVRFTGGLADTVVPYAKGKGNGFGFKEYTGAAMLQAVQQACGVFADQKEWQQVRANGMAEDFSWGHSARQYSELYKDIVEKK